MPNAHLPRRGSNSIANASFSPPGSRPYPRYLRAPQPWLRAGSSRHRTQQPQRSRRRLPALALGSCNSRGEGPHCGKSGATDTLNSIFRPTTTMSGTTTIYYGEPPITSLSTTSTTTTRLTTTTAFPLTCPIAALP